MTRSRVVDGECIVNDGPQSGIVGILGLFDNLELSIVLGNSRHR